MHFSKMHFSQMHFSKMHFLKMHFCRLLAGRSARRSRLLCARRTTRHRRSTWPAFVIVVSVNPKKRSTRCCVGLLDLPCYRWPDTHQSVSTKNVMCACISYTGTSTYIMPHFHFRINIFCDLYIYLLVLVFS